MLIPTRDQCLSLMEQVRMPLHIQRHSLRVAQIASYLGCLLNQNGNRLNLPLLEAAALLHDLGKERSFRTGERHEYVGATMLQEMGYHALAPIVQEHVSMDAERIDGPITESILVNYADKRVKHDEIVSVQERFRDLVERYAKTEAHRTLMGQKLELYRILEKRIFVHLTVSPADVGSASLPLGTCLKIGSEDYDRQKTNSGTFGWGKIG